MYLTIVSMALQFYLTNQKLSVNSILEPGRVGPTSTFCYLHTCQSTFQAEHDTNVKTIRKKTTHRMIRVQLSTMVVPISSGDGGGTDVCKCKQADPNTQYAEAQQVTVDSTCPYIGQDRHSTPCVVVNGVVFFYQTEILLQIDAVPLTFKSIGRW